MNTVFALILVWPRPPRSPTARATPRSTFTVKTPSVFACLMTGQTSVAREQLLGDGRYTKVVCGSRREFQPPRRLGRRAEQGPGQPHVAHPIREVPLTGEGLHEDCPLRMAGTVGQPTTS